MSRGARPIPTPLDNQNHKSCSNCTVTVIYEIHSGSGNTGRYYPGWDIHVQSGCTLFPTMCPAPWVGRVRGRRRGTAADTAAVLAGTGGSHTRRCQWRSGGGSGEGWGGGGGGRWGVRESSAWAFFASWPHHCPGCSTAPQDEGQNAHPHAITVVTRMMQLCADSRAPDEDASSSTPPVPGVARGAGL